MRIAWLTDWHGIFVDPKAWDLALRLTQLYKPTHVPVGSDDLDFYRISKFDKNPDRRIMVQDELNRHMELCRELKTACDPYWEAIEKPGGYVPVVHPTVLGNHNERYFKTLWNDPKFFGLQALEYRSLMGYEKFGFSWAGEPWDYQSNLEWSPFSGLKFIHGTKASARPGYSVQNEMASRFYDASLIMGHCHRGAMTVVSKPDGTQLVGIEGFCLCDLHPEYQRITNWTQGVVFVTFESTVPDYEVVPFVRKDGRLIAHWRGSEYSVAA